ncbi:MAG: hypothetical protein ACK5LC_17630 [Coprobacillaceae bacterium]
MKYKKSWVNKALLINILKNNLLPLKVSLLLFSGFTLLGIISEGAFIMAIGIFLVSAFVLTTIYAGIVQGYLSNKTDSTYMRTLPIASSTLWFTQYLAGFILIIIPLLIQIFCIYISSIQYETYMLEAFLSKMFFSAIVLVFIYYSISFFVVCISGKRIGQFLFSLAFYSIPAGLYIGIALIGKTLAMGDINNSSLDNIRLFLPVLSGIDFLTNYDITTWPFLIFHLFIGVSFFIGSYFVYKHRPLEKTDEIIIFSPTNYMIRIVIVFAGTMAIYLLFIYGANLVYAHEGNAFILNIVLYIIIGIVFALGMELLFKSTHIYRSLAIYIPLICLSIFACYQTGNYNYIKEKEKIQDMDTISITVGEYHDEVFYQWIQSELSKETVTKLIDYLEKHKEQVYTSVYPIGDIVDIHIFGYKNDPYMDTIIYEDEVPNYVTQTSRVDLTYYVEEQVFKDFLMENDAAMLGEIMKYRIDQELDIILSEPYWQVYNSNAIVEGEGVYYPNTDGEMVSLFSSNDLKDIKSILSNRKYQYEDLFKRYTYDIRWEYSYINSVLLDIPEIQEIVFSSINQENVKLATQAIELIEKEFGYDKSTSEVLDIVEGETLTKSQNIALVDNDIYMYLIKMEDNKYYFELPMYVEIKDTDIGEQDNVEEQWVWVDYTIEIDVQYEDGEMKLQNIKEVGYYYE